MPRTGRNRAFTLVELLLGLAIAGIIGVAVYSLFWMGLKLDKRLRSMHENYTELLIADQSLSGDLENAVWVDLSLSYPDLKTFDGQSKEIEFVTRTPKGLKRVRYYSGLVDWGETTRTIIGGKLGNQSRTLFSSEEMPVEFLLRQETDFTDWVNNTPGPVQIVAAGLRKGSFRLRYAPFTKEIKDSGHKALTFSEVWDGLNLPMVVQCSFSLYSSGNPDKDIAFSRDIFLAPLSKQGSDNNEE